MLSQTSNPEGKLNQSRIFEELTKNKYHQGPVRERRTRIIVLSIVLMFPTMICLGDRPSSRLGENFVIGAPSKELAKRGLERADVYRKQIALDWLGHELEPGESFADIHIYLATTGQEDSGRVWLANHETGRPHMMWLTGTREDVLGAGMAHEIAHVVLASRFPSGMPVWANEGIASYYDDQERLSIRGQIMQRIVESSAWPSIDEILTATNIKPSDQTAYALSSSLTEYLVSLRGREAFVEFVSAAMSSSWDAAITKIYGMNDRHELQTKWQAWAATPRSIL